MTKKKALMTAIAILNTDPDNAKVVATLTAMVEQLNKHTERTPEQKEAQNAKRRETNAKARAEMIAKVAPVLREGLTHTLQGVTAKELFSLVKDNLPEDFTAPKVQNILLREMKNELEIIESKGKANLYRLAEC